MNVLFISLLTLFNYNVDLINDPLLGEWKVISIDIDYKPEDESIKNNYAKKDILEGYIEKELLQKEYLIKIEKEKCSFLEKGKVVSSSNIFKIEKGKIIDEKEIVIFTYKLGEDNQTCEFVAVDGTVFKAEKIEK